MNVSISLPDSDGLGLSGLVPVTVTVDPVSNVRAVDFYVDGVKRASATAAPYVFQWDTRLVGDGTHVLRADARYKTRKSTAQLAVTVANAAASAPPPSTVGSPLGYLSYRAPSFFPAQIGKYGVFVGEGPMPAGFVGRNLRYRTAITCQAGVTNISEATCLANNWQLRDAAGNLTNVKHGGVLADPGNLDYQAAWCQATLAAAQAMGAQGVFVDDSNPRITSLSGGRYPIRYPTEGIIPSRERYHASA